MIEAAIARSILVAIQNYFILSASHGLTLSGYLQKLFFFLEGFFKELFQI